MADLNGNYNALLDQSNTQDYDPSLASYLQRDFGAALNYSAQYEYAFNYLCDIVGSSPVLLGELNSYYDISSSNSNLFSNSPAVNVNYSISNTTIGASGSYTITQANSSIVITCLVNFSSTANAEASVNYIAEYLSKETGQYIDASGTFASYLPTGSNLPPDPYDAEEHNPQALALSPMISLADQLLSEAAGFYNELFIEGQVAPEDSQFLPFQLPSTTNSNQGQLTTAAQQEIQQQNATLIASRPLIGDLAAFFNPGDGTNPNLLARDGANVTVQNKAITLAMWAAVTAVQLQTDSSGNATKIIIHDGDGVQQSSALNATDSQSASGDFKSVLDLGANNSFLVTGSNVESIVSDYEARGTFGAATAIEIDQDYMGLDGGGALVQTVIAFSSGGTETIMGHGVGVVPTFAVAGGASIATTYTVSTGGATLTQIAAELGLDPYFLAGINPGDTVSATLAAGTSVNIYGTAEGTSLPSIDILHGLTSAQCCYYNTDTDRYFVTGATGSNGGKFIVVNDSGTVLYSGAGSGVNVVSFAPVAVSGGSVVGGVLVSTSAGSQQLPFAGWYDVQPGDTWPSIATLLSNTGTVQTAAILQAINPQEGATPTPGTAIHIPLATEGQASGAYYGGATNNAVDYVLNVSTMSISDAYDLPGVTDGDKTFVIDNNGDPLAIVPSEDTYLIAGNPPTLTIAGVTYMQGANGTAPVQAAYGDSQSGTGITLTPSPPFGTVSVMDGSGSGSIVFDNPNATFGHPDMWTAGAGTDTATLSGGVTNIAFTGAQSQYTVTYTPSSKTITITDTVSGRTGVKTIMAPSGGANIDFNGHGLGSSQIFLGSGTVGNHGSTGNDAFQNEGDIVPLTVDGSLTYTMTGDGGNDAYSISPVSGETDEIFNGVSTSNAPAGTILFYGQQTEPAQPHPVTEASNQLWFMNVNNNLVIDVLGTTEQVIVENWFVSGDAYAQVASIVASDATLTNAKVQALVTAMATYSSANTSFNPQAATVMPTNAALTTAIDAAWGVQDGMPGTTSYYGTNSQDTFEFTPADGQDQVFNFTPGSGSSSDILDLSNPANGTVKLTDVISREYAIIGLGGTQLVSATATGAEITKTSPGSGSGWNFLTAVDTNGDGLADILWQSQSTGQIDLWTATGTGYIDRGVIDNNTSMTGWALLYAEPDKAGQPADLLWYGTGTGSGSNAGVVRSWVIGDGGSGAVTVTDGPWNYQGAPAAPQDGGSYLGQMPDGPIYAGDFNGDGHQDLLFRWATTGSNTALFIYELDGNQELGDDYVRVSPSSPVNGSSTSLSTSFNIAAVADFNGDGKSDLLLQNTLSGAVQYWCLGGGSIGQTLVGTITTSVETGWSCLGAADLFGNGEQDAIWLSGNSGEADYGNVYEWEVQNSGYNQIYLGQVGSNMTYFGAADLNGDGTADLVWQNTLTNAITIWWSGFANNSSLQLATPITKLSALQNVIDSTKITYGISNGTPVPTADLIGLDANGNAYSVTSAGSESSPFGPGSGWNFLKAVDTNGDGLADLLWQNKSNGEIDLWTATGTGYTDRGVIDNNTSMSGWALLYAEPDKAGQSADLLWYGTGTGSGSNAGVVRSWVIGDSGSGAVTVTDGPWNYQGSPAEPQDGGSYLGQMPDGPIYAGDFNGDGHQDLLFRWATTGSNTALFIYELDGNQELGDDYVRVSPSSPVNGSSTSLSTSFKIAAVADFNGDGKSDLLLQNTSSGAVQYWCLGGGSIGQTLVGTITTSVETGWSCLGAADLFGNGEQDAIWLSGNSGEADFGNVYEWEVQNSGYNQTTIGNVGSNMTYFGAADLNGDGTDDLVWQNSSTDAITIWWSGLESNNTTLQLSTPVTSIAALADVLTPTAGSSTVTLQGVTPGQLSLYNNIIGASTLDDSALPGALTVNLSLPAGQTANSLTHIQNVIGNNAGDTITGNALGGTLTGGTGNDVFVGSGGTNVIFGAGGSDTYQINANDVLDTISNGVSTSNTAAGQVDFLGSTDQNLWFIHTGNNLVVDVLGTTKQVVLQNWYSNAYSQVSEIVDDAGLKLDTSLSNLITAMATFAANNSGFNPQTTMNTSLSNTSYYGTTLASAVTSSWHS